MASTRVHNTQNTQKIERDDCLIHEFLCRIERVTVDHYSCDESVICPCKAEEKKEDTPSYFLHRVGSQLVSAASKATAIGFRSAGFYQALYSKYHLNPSDDVFKNPATFIYQEGNFTSSALSILLPKKMRKADVSTAEQLKSLDKISSNGLFDYERSFMKLSNALDVLLNTASIYTYFTDDKESNPQLLATYVTRTLASAIFFVGSHHQGGGSKYLRKCAESGINADYQKAYFEYFRPARAFFIIFNTIQALGGIAKIVAETINAFDKSKKVNGAAILDGGQQIGIGLSWLFFNLFLIKKSGELAIKGNMESATEIHRLRFIVLPPRYLWTVRAAGLFGVAISTTQNGQDIYSGMFDDTISEKGKEHKLISGSIGMTSSVLLGASAYLINPATLPVGSACFAGSIILLCGQTIYDEWDNGLSYLYEEMVNEMAYLYGDIEDVYVETVNKTAFHFKKIEQMIKDVKEFEYEPLQKLILDIYGDAEEYVFEPTKKEVLKAAGAANKTYDEIADEVAGSFKDADKNIIKPLGELASDMAYIAAMKYAGMADKMAGILANSGRFPEITPAQ